ncbi:MAG: FkbM family methyltransferase [Chitinophagaceae bacterium]|nr:MAG: FkbM family methyltransferase [Chitinophagaceae bacterium]
MIKENLKLAFSKLLFCLRICSNLQSFVKLVINTRKFSQNYQANPGGPKTSADQVSVCYSLRLPSGKHNIYLRTYRGDIAIFYELFWQRVYALKPLSEKRGMTIIDAGAHIGMATLFFLENYPVAKIYCIEPDPANLRLLHKNLRAEISGGVVSVISCAISGDEGMRRLQNTGWSYNSHLVIDSGFEQDLKTEMVPVKTIAGILRENNIDHVDLLKIDIEGAETDLFLHEPDWLNRIDNLLIEIHSEQGKVQIRSLLTRLGFSFEKWNKNPHGDVYLASAGRSPS